MSNESDWDVIGPRLRKLADPHKRTEIAARAGLSKSTVDNILAGKSEPAFSKVVRFAGAIGESLEMVAYGIDRKESGDCGADNDEFVDISLLDVQASAGPGIINGDVVESPAIKFRNDWVLKRGVHPEALNAIRVRGDSMEPTLRNGDLIVVDVSNRGWTDGIFVIGFEDHVQVKRLQRLSPTRLVIASDNPLAGSSEIDLRDESQHPRIIGRVIWLGRDL